ncbi:MAG: peroxiredoxin [Phycisphaerae bacterium]|nr:peroxiredoxin [Phycisphaerae bacterium]
MGVRVGDTAPELALPDQDGRPWALSAFRGVRPVVLFFYPRAHTSGCTAQACAFRDAYADFREAGAEVAGVSSDGRDRQRSFGSGNRLPFTLLCDEHGVARRALGVPRTLWVLPGRTTYVIDASGVVRLVFNSQTEFGRHAAEALAVVRALAGRAAEGGEHA